MQLGERSRAAHASSGSGNRKLTEADKREIARRYVERVRNGTKYGAIKDLGYKFDVSDTTIQGIVKPHKPKRIRK